MTTSQPSLLSEHRRSRRNFLVGERLNDGDSGIQVRGFLPFAHPQRQAVSDYQPHDPGYFNAFPNNSAPQLVMSPPSYDRVAEEKQKNLPPQLARFKVEPREEEGREQLPGYSCSLDVSAVFSRKMEMDAPFKRAEDRSWRTVYATIRGTILFLHKVKTARFFSKPTLTDLKARGRTDMPPGTSAGALIKSYTLQHAEVGIAADYKKRHYVIRLRVETDQFLLSCVEVETFLSWLESLSAAIDLSPPLDERSAPRYHTLPRRRRRNRDERNGRFRDTLELRREQEEIMRRNYPRLAANMSVMDLSSATRERPRRPIRPYSSATERYQPRNIGGENAQADDISDVRDVLDTASIFGRSTTIRIRVGRSRYRLHFSERLSEVEQGENEGQKWQPHHRWTRQQNIRYAKRCMAILAADAPRQSDLVFKDGKRWHIDWETGQMTEWPRSNPVITGVLESEGTINMLSTLPKTDRVDTGKISKHERGDPPTYADAVGTSTKKYGPIFDLQIVPEFPSITLA